MRVGTSAVITPCYCCYSCAEYTGIAVLYYGSSAVFVGGLMYNLLMVLMYESTSTTSTATDGLYITETVL